MRWGLEGEEGEMPDQNKSWGEGEGGEEDGGAKSGLRRVEIGWIFKGERCYQGIGGLQIPPPSSPKADKLHRGSLFRGAVWRIHCFIHKSLQAFFLGGQRERWQREKETRYWTEKNRKQ